MALWQGKFICGIIARIPLDKEGYLTGRTEVITMVYRVIIEKGEDFGYVVHCPAIPGCHSQGNTIEEAIENVKDAIRGCLSVLDEEVTVSANELGVMEIEI